MGESERGGVDMDDDETRKGRRKRLGVTLSCQLVHGANACVMQRRKRGETREILAMLDVVSFCELCCRLRGGLLVF